MARCKLLGVNILYGINTVTEALKARGRNFEWVAVAKERKDIRREWAIDGCRKIGVPVRVLSRVELDEIAGNAAHQGLVAATSAKQYSDLDDLGASRRGERSLIVVLDGVEDPHNLGAILRTAAAAGADAVGIPQLRSAAVTAAAATAGRIQGIMRFLCIFGVILGLTSAVWALEREAFTIAKCDLEIRLEPEQQRLGARGRITLRNDSAHPQKIVALQISSSLSWRSIRVDGKALQYLSHSHVSD